MRYVIAETPDGLDAPDAERGWELERLVYGHPAVGHFPRPGSSSVTAGAAETTEVSLWRDGDLVHLSAAEGHMIATHDGTYRVTVDHIRGGDVADRRHLWVRTSGQDREDIRQDTLKAEQAVTDALAALKAAREAHRRAEDRAHAAGLTPADDGISG